jgi:hypothetical protein
MGVAMNPIKIQDDDGEFALQKQEAYMRLNHAWQQALTAGIEPDVVAQTALFAALSDLVVTYGEDAVADYTAQLAEKVNRGEFSVRRPLN